MGLSPCPTSYPLPLPWFQHFQSPLMAFNAFGLPIWPPGLFLCLCEYIFMVCSFWISLKGTPVAVMVNQPICHYSSPHSLKASFYVYISSPSLLELAIWTTSSEHRHIMTLSHRSIFSFTVNAPPPCWPPSSFPILLSKPSLPFQIYLPFNWYTNSHSSLCWMSFRAWLANGQSWKISC